MPSDVGYEEAPPPSPRGSIPKAATGIHGFDEICGGGLPRGRPTLVCGGPGTGKTLFGLEFIVRGAAELGEPGVFVSFAETCDELVANSADINPDIPRLIREERIALDQVRVERGELVEAGAYDLEGLFIRLDSLIRSVGAKRLVLDGLDALFAVLPEQQLLRGELSRLFRWLKEREVTTVVTAERGGGELTRDRIEEYVSDCVVLLEQRSYERSVTRHLRIVKYRGSGHGTSEYPFLIHEQGISVVPLSSVSLDHPVSTEQVSLGIPRLDLMLGRQGVFRGTSVLISGGAGTGKSSIAVHAAHAACARGERCLYVAFEEAPRQIIRNMRSIGIDLEPWEQQGLLRFSAERPTMADLEMHLSLLHRQVESFAPDLVVVDPITNLITVGSPSEVRSMLTRLIDFLKGRLTTALFVSLTAEGRSREESTAHVSSLMDTWLIVESAVANGERNRLLTVQKSRGMHHSNQVREFILSSRGVELADVYLGPAGVLTGSARRAQEAREAAEVEARRHRIERLERDLVRRRQALEGRITEMRADLTAVEDRLRDLIARERLEQEEILSARVNMALQRQADLPAGPAAAPAPPPEPGNGGSTP